MNTSPQLRYHPGDMADPCKCDCAKNAMDSSSEQGADSTYKCYFLLVCGNRNLEDKFKYFYMKQNFLSANISGIFLYNSHDLCPYNFSLSVDEIISKSTLYYWICLSVCLFSDLIFVQLWYPH